MRGVGSAKNFKQVLLFTHLFCYLCQKGAETKYSPKCTFAKHALTNNKLKLIAMANKRDLKHEINFITTELVNECLFLKEYTTEMPAEKCETLINRILDIQDEYIRRANRTDGKDSPKLVKAYYKKLIQDFDAAIGEILKEIGE